ncbi:MAG: MOSC domain-containing protein [Acidimicrobiales bacterium]
MAPASEPDSRPNPWGDSQFHLTADELCSRFEALPNLPTDSTTLGLIVLRRPEGVRGTPDQVEVNPNEGLVGDRWSVGKHGTDDQITIMRGDIGELVANGQDQSLFGDNLLMNLDLSQENLPAGTRLAIGDALTEVTVKPHTGCSQYVQRFGRSALRLVNGKEFRHLRLRGLHVRVIRAGVIHVGDPVEVQRPN